ncbi:hypothetical protein J4438_03445 [Candidatus Woesearchaeota archaeon]|nr:hypothetical protein [Candidatus Woesearchaeota archaeon]
MKLETLYTIHYKKLLAIMLIIFAIAVIFLFNQYSTKGYFIEKDISLKGGISATIYTEEKINQEDVKNLLLEENPTAEVSTRELKSLGSEKSNGILIETSNIEIEQVRSFIDTNYPTADISIQQVGSNIGDTFFKEMITAMLFAFLLMSIVVFFTFKKAIPSLAVILSVVFDVVLTLVVINIIGLKISSAGIAAFLMIIGYSVDTDILLTTRVLKRKEGTAWERSVGAFKTGIMMTITAITAILVGLIATNSLVIKEMFTILVIALVFDIIATWVMNTSLLLWYLNKNVKTA